MCSTHGEDQLEGYEPVVHGNGNAFVIIIINVAKDQVLCHKCVK